MILLYFYIFINIITACPEASSTKPDFEPNSEVAQKIKKMADLIPVLTSMCKFSTNFNSIWLSARLIRFQTYFNLVLAGVF